MSIRNITEPNTIRLFNIKTFEQKINISPTTGNVVIVNTEPIALITRIGSFYTCNCEFTMTTNVDAYGVKLEGFFDDLDVPYTDITNVRMIGGGSSETLALGEGGSQFSLLQKDVLNPKSFYCVFNSPDITNGFGAAKTYLVSISFTFQLIH